MALLIFVSGLFIAVFFFWTIVAHDGQVFGDPSRGSLARVTNGLWFSYPGYNELLAGYPSGGKPDTSVPYVMWAGTPYAHLMVPVSGS